MRVGGETGFFLRPEFIKNRLTLGLSRRFSDLRDVDTQYFLEFIEETIPPLQIKNNDAILSAIVVGHYAGIGSSLTKDLLEFVEQNHVIDMNKDNKGRFRFTPDGFRVYAALVVNLAKTLADLKARIPGKEENKRTLQIYAMNRDEILPRVVIETREKLGENPLAQQIHIESIS